MVLKGPSFSITFFESQLIIAVTPAAPVIILPLPPVLAEILPSSILLSLVIYPLGLLFTRIRSRLLQLPLLLWRRAALGIRLALLL